MNSPAAALLEVEHLTRYRYAAPVGLAHHLAHLRPLEDERQQVERFAIEVAPEPMHRTDDADRLGNHRQCFTHNRPHRELQVHARSRVRVLAPPALDPSATLAWEAVRERLRYAAGRAFEPASEFVHTSPYVPALAEVAAWAEEAFTPGRAVAEVGIALMGKLHGGFAYRTESTEVDTPLAAVLDRREGVCQDFAHLLIGALRSKGLAARYVSGYLLTAPPDPGAGHAPSQGESLPVPLLGADASHAWIALWCPPADGSQPRWLELDPTNNLLPSINHVRLAAGRDYGDVTPLRGVIRGGGEHQLEVRVRTKRVA
jgi:transglutaminase-like putative cysteine protease